MLSATLTSSVTTATVPNNFRSSSVAVKYGGTFSAGTVKIQARTNGSTDWDDLTGSSFDEVKSFVLDVSRDWQLRAVITSADGSDSVDVSINRTASNL